METDPRQIRLASIGLATLAILGFGVYGLLEGFPASAGGWWREMVAETATLPENNPEVMYASALQYQQEGNHTMATAAARRAVIAAPNYAPAHRFLATEALNDKDFDTAAKECRNILQNDPNDGAARLGLASAYSGLGQESKAQEIYQSIVNDGAFGMMVRRAAQDRLNVQRSASAQSVPAPGTTIPSPAPPQMSPNGSK